MYRENLIDADFTELYHANGSSEGYDNFNQLTDFSRGEFTSGKHTVGSPDRELEWELDAMGNWESLATDSGSPETREHNKQNQVTEVGSDDLDFDDNGNTTTDENGNTLVYDAWNRLVSFDDGTDTVTYAYDALSRRTERTLDSVTTDFFYSDKWQVLEERVSGNAHAQYVWSPVYVDALIVRDRDADSSSGNGLEERVFVLQDANFNVTAIANAAGTVQERYVYDPYGTPTRLTASWGTPSGDTYNWVYLHQGGRYEAATGLYNFRNRDLSPTLGRWLSLDPLGLSGPQHPRDVRGHNSNEDYQTSLKPSTSVSPESFRLFTESSSFESMAFATASPLVPGVGSLGARPINLYLYVSNDPVGLVDPTGLWELRCRNLKGLGYWTFQMHCWVECNGHSYSLLQHEKLPVAEKKKDDPRDLGKGFVASSGDGACDCIEAAFERNKESYMYDFNDCNSNWYANNLLKACGIKVPKPGAYGWDACKRPEGKFKPEICPDKLPGNYA